MCRTIPGAPPTTTPPPFTEMPPSAGEIHLLQCCITLVLHCLDLVAQLLRPTPRVASLKIDPTLGKQQPTVGHAKCEPHARSRRAELRPSRALATPWPHAYGPVQWLLGQPSQATGSCWARPACRFGQASGRAAHRMNWAACSVLAHGVDSKLNNFPISRISLNSV
jgi:hypothetical protein